MGFFYVEIRHADLGDLITRAKSKAGDNSPEMDEIVRRFDGLAVAVAHGLTRDRYLREDLANAARFAVVKAVRNHTTGHDGFPSYVKTYMVGAAKRELGCWAGTEVHEEVHSVGLDDEIDADALLKLHDEQPTPTDRTWGSVFMMEAVAKVKPEQQELLEWRFIEDMAISNIAGIKGVTESAISQQLSTVMKVIKQGFVAA